MLPRLAFILMLALGVAFEPKPTPVLTPTPQPSPQPTTGPVRIVFGLTAISVALVLAAAQPWSPATHCLFPAAARAHAEALFLLGHHMSREPSFEAVAGIWVDLWVQLVMPHLVKRA